MDVLLVHPSDQGGRPSHCAQHGKPLGYVDVVNNKCSECARVANFGPADGKVSKCKEHGEPLGYVNLNALKTRKCLETGCNIQPNYGKEGGQPEYCAAHGKALGLKDVHHKRCADDRCNKYPAFAVEDSKPATVCHEHGH